MVNQKEQQSQITSPKAKTSFKRVIHNHEQFKLTGKRETITNSITSKYTQNT